MSTSNNNLRNTGLGIVLLHSLVTAIHANAHTRLTIVMSLWQNAFIFIVIVALPVIAGFLIWRRARYGFQLLAFSMFGSLLFGGYYHFIALGPDNVASLPEHSWSMPFYLTAILIALIEAAGTVIGFMGLRSR